MPVNIAVVDEYNVWQFAASTFLSQLPLQGVDVPTLLVRIRIRIN
jgi:hypothetical protein